MYMDESTAGEWTAERLAFVRRLQLVNRKGSILCLT